MTEIEGKLSEKFDSCTDLQHFLALIHQSRFGVVVQQKGLIFGRSKLLRC